MPESPEATIENIASIESSSNPPVQPEADSTPEQRIESISESPQVIKEEVLDTSVSESFEPEVETSQEDATTNPSKKIDSLMMPSLGSLDDLLSETKAELSAIPAEKIPLDNNVVNQVWKAYSDSVESLSTKSTLELVKTRIANDKVEITVPSNVSKEEIIQEIDLFQNLRNAFNDNMLEIVVNIDRDQFPELMEKQTKQIYTIKEKYDHLLSKNQKLDSFVKTLNLKIDQE